MEVLVTHEIERKKDGTKIVRNFFFNNDKTNYLVKAHSYFTEDEKKEHKINYVKKENERLDIIDFLLKQPHPNWNIKFSLLR